MRLLDEFYNEYGFPVPLKVTTSFEMLVTTTGNVRFVSLPLSYKTPLKNVSFESIICKPAVGLEVINLPSTYFIPLTVRIVACPSPWISLIDACFKFMRNSLLT